LKRLLSIIVIALLVMFTVFQTGCPTATKPTPQKSTQGKPKATNQAPDRKPRAVKPVSAKLGRFFPLTKGSTWSYLGEGNEFASFSREVLFTRGNLAQIQEGNGGTVSAMVFRTTGTAVTRVLNFPETYDPVNLLGRKPNDSTVILKAPLRAGTKWKTPGGSREIVSVNEVVTTPAGTFRNCILVKIPGKESTVKEYFKEGVGMVKREFESGETRVSSTLEKYTIKK